MKIQTLNFAEKPHGWQINNAIFDNMNLLVGVSGVGKTRILNAINTISRIAQGEFFDRSFSWEIGLKINQSFYQWCGELSAMTENDYSQIVSERLEKDGVWIAERDEDGTFVSSGTSIDESMLIPNISMVHSLPHPEFSCVRREMKKVISWNEPSWDQKETRRFPSDTKTNIEKIRTSHHDIRTKLYLCSQFAPEQMDEIREQFFDIFPFVTDLRVGVDRDAVRNRIQLKERGMNDWIDERQLSHGMQKVLMQIAQIHLCESGSVFLLDNVETGLGLNCIGDFVRNMMIHGRDLQFIVATHHPYVINQISHENWRVVVRDTNKTSFANISDLKDKKTNQLRSKHESFTQLINWDTYLDGIS